MRQCKEVIDLQGKLLTLVDSSQAMTLQNMELLKENKYLKVMQLEGSADAQKKLLEMENECQRKLDISKQKHDDVSIKTT